LEQLADYCREKDITAQWFVPASSESGFEPNRSVLDGDPSRAEIDLLEQQYKEALALEQAGEWENAAEIYRRGLEKHPEFAEFHFRLGDCLFQLKDYQTARTHYDQSRDLDGHPVRANADYRKAVTEVAEEHQIPLIDTLALLRSHSPHDLLDRSVFHDNVHPTLKTYYYLGTEAVAQAIGRNLFTSRLGDAAEIAPARYADAVRDAGLVPDDVALAYKRYGDHFKWLGQLRSENSRRLRQGDEYLDRAEKLKAGTIEPGQEGTDPLK
jgi:tetratricopeptide (TPR) repeat protein